MANKIIIFFVSFLLLLPLMPAQVFAAEATLYIAPASGTFVIGGEFSISVKVNSGGQAINAAEGSLTFNSDVLEVKALSKGGSIFNFWSTEPRYNNTEGTVHFGGGLPNPGYTGTSGQVITVTFKAKKADNGVVRFSSGAVLANDGKGTNILASMGSANYAISPKVEAPENPQPSQGPGQERGREDKPAEPEYNKPAIKSDTHPEENAWSNRRNARFTWDLPEGVTGVSYAFDKNPDTDPGNSSDGLISEKSFENLEDGAHYFHLKFKDAKRWGTTAHYKILIDTEAPLPFDIKIRMMIGDWPTLEFEAEDEDSGLERYEVNIGSLEKQAHVLEALEKELKVHNLNVGEHTAQVIAYDKAGNMRMSTIHFTIDPIEDPVINNLTREIKASDKLYVSGTAVKNANVNLFIEDGQKIVATSTVRADGKGDWFFMADQGLPNGRYVVWAQAENENGIESLPSKRESFLVSPPVFATIGDFVINYFTVFVSLLFMVILIVIAILYLAQLIRRRLKKETIEVEEVLRNNLRAYKKEFEKEFTRLSKFEGQADYPKEKARMKTSLKRKIDSVEKKIMKEVKDVENILD